MTGQVLTDGMPRRETNFAAVRWNQSATMAADEPYLLSGPEHTHRVVDDQDRWQTTESWAGITSVEASSSQSDANAIPPLEIGSHPGAALDRDKSTAWRSARHLDPTGQFWQENFGSTTNVDSISVTMPSDAAPVDKLEFWAGGFQVEAPAPKPGSTRSYLTHLGTGDFLRITAVGRDLSLPGSFALSEVQVRDLFPLRFLSLPDPDPDLPVDLVSLTRDPDRAPCLNVGRTYPCVQSLVAAGEDGDSLVRQFQVNDTASYALAGTVSLRRSIDGLPFVDSGLSATSDEADSFDVAAGPTAMLDADPGTTWLSQDGDETVSVQFPETTELKNIRVRVNPAAAASRPTRIKLTSEGRARVVSLDKDGRGVLPRWEVDKVDLQVVATEPAFLVVGQRFVQAPAGISTLTFGGFPLAKEQRAAATTSRTFGCGSGPTINIDRRVFQTEVVASTRELVRGARVPFRICGSELSIVHGGVDHVISAPPSALFRVDTLDLTRVGAGSAATQPLDLDRDDRGMPTSVHVAERSGPTVLTLPQNLNVGWVATFDGKTLPTTRVAGWKQAWVLPAGAAGTVHLSYPPDRTFGWALGLGAIGVALVLLVVVVPLVRRRTPRRVESGRVLPALETGRPGLLDLVVAFAVPALLAGWWGVIAAGATIVVATILRRVFHGWALLAGLAFIIGATAMSWDRLTEQSWAVEWTQAWSLVAIVCLVGGLVRSGRRHARHDGRPDLQRADARARPVGEPVDAHGVVLPGARGLQRVLAGEQGHRHLAVAERDDRRASRSSRCSRSGAARPLRRRVRRG